MKITLNPYKIKVTRITLNEINDTIEEIPSKLLLVINAINKINAAPSWLWQTLIEELQTSNRIQNNVVEQVLQIISNNSTGISTTINKGFQEVENQNLEKCKQNKRAYIYSLEKYIKLKEASIFFNITKLKILEWSSQIYTRIILRKCQNKFYQKLYQMKTKKKQLLDSN